VTDLPASAAAAVQACPILAASRGRATATFQPKAPALLERLSLALFVLIWSTGWIVAKSVAEAQADPLTFLVLRYLSAGLLIAGFAWIVGASWPSTPRQWMHGLVSGVLLHAIYLGGVWWVIDAGLPAGISALIAALQPLLTAFLARPLLGERITLTNAIGVATGFAGVLIVLGPKYMHLNPGSASSSFMLVAINVAAMFAVTFGTFYQKRFVAQSDLRSITAVQYLGAFVVTLPVAALLEPMHIPPTLETLYALLWSVLVLSIGAISLMLVMIRRGAVSKVASLIYLIPPTAAVQAWLMFGEVLTPMQILGMAITALGVFLATRR